MFGMGVFKSGHRYYRYKLGHHCEEQKEGGNTGNGQCPFWPGCCILHIICPGILHWQQRCFKCGHNDQVTFHPHGDHHNESRKTNRPGFTGGWNGHDQDW